jgi:uncharacterized membrane protein
MPIVGWINSLIRPEHPAIANIIENPAFKSFVAIILVLIFLYILGWLTTKVIGRKIVKKFDDLLDKIPMVRIVYGGSKKILESFQKRPDHQQQVVLINYPSPEMKTVGLITRAIIDESTGEKLAAVYVPTTPNPTSGFLEIVPFKDIIMTDWTVNEAISFIVSGGVVGPDEINYRKNGKLDVKDELDENNI